MRSSPISWQHACVAVLIVSFFGSGPAFAQTKRAKKPAKATKPAKAKKPAPKPVAYTNATIHVGNGTVYRRGTVLIRGDKIEAVGHKIHLPKDTKVVDCDGLHICPGFVIFDLPGCGAPSRVGKGESYGDAIDPFNRTMKRALAAGITSYLTTSSTSGSTPSGTSAVIKLVPESIQGAIVKEPAVYGMSVPLGPKAWKSFDDTLEKIAKYKKELAAYKKKQSEQKKPGASKAKAPKKPPKYDEFASVMEGKSKLRISAAGSGGMGRFRMFGGGGSGSLDVTKIREALRIAKKLGVPVILNKAEEAWIIPDEIAATDSSCILMPRGRSAPDRTRAEPNGPSIQATAILAKAVVQVAVLPSGGIFGGGIGSGGLLGNDLNTPTVDPCYAIRGGLAPRDALATITLAPAQMMGVGDRIGSIEDGKDADILILDGDPLHYKTFVQTAIVNGRVVYEKSVEPFYRHIRPLNK